jgi:hypothetical protein
MKIFVKFQFWVLVVLTGILISLSYVSNLFGSWYPKARVPGMPSQILDDYPTVRTSDALLYSCDSWRCVLIETEYSPRSSDDNFTTCYDPHVQPLIYPGKVTASLAERLCGSDDHITSTIIALDDGSVWVWRSSTLGGWLHSLLGSIMGIIAVAVLVIPLLRWLYGFDSRPQQKAKNDTKTLE